MKSLVIATLSVCAIWAVTASDITQANEAETASELAPMAVCNIGEMDGFENHIVFHLSGFDDSGTVFYRAITSNVIELKIKEDGTVLSEANPCRNELKFFNSSFGNDAK